MMQKQTDKQQALKAERARLEQMRAFDWQYASLGRLCGIDEVGRGPLAGPVVAAAVILPPDCEILYVNDSKKLSAKRREALYDEITKKAVSVGIGSASPQRIDEINILRATVEAMQQAIDALDPPPEGILVDAVTITSAVQPQVSIIKGDAKSISISSASIIAKVTRDKMMVEYDRIYPQYDFAANKGYGTKAHIKALQEYGPSPIHRKSFITHFIET